MPVDQAMEQDRTEIYQVTSKTVFTSFINSFTTLTLPSLFTACMCSECSRVCSPLVFVETHLATIGWLYMLKHNWQPLAGCKFLENFQLAANPLTSSDHV